MPNHTEKSNTVPLTFYFCSDYCHHLQCMFLSKDYPIFPKAWSSRWLWIYFAFIWPNPCTHGVSTNSMHIYSSYFCCSLEYSFIMLQVTPRNNISNLARWNTDNLFTECWVNPVSGWAIFFNPNTCKVNPPEVIPLLLNWFYPHILSIKIISFLFSLISKF